VQEGLGSDGGLVQMVRGTKRVLQELKPVMVAEASAPQQPVSGAVRAAYCLAGVATTSAWTTVVWTTIRSNQPLGAMMPSVEHGVFARLGALSAVPLIASCFGVLASADTWETMRTDTCRRLNLALVGAGTGSALWVGFAPIVTAIPGLKKVSGAGVAPHLQGRPLNSHAAFRGMTRAALIASYASAAALGAAVWASSLPEEVRRKPWTWPGRIADGICKSLVSLGPRDTNDATNVKYAVLSSSFLLMTALQLHQFPTAVIPSWTGRRCSRAFPAWTLLAAVSAFNLKEARESGQAFADSTCRSLSNGLTGFGATYLLARVGAVFLDPSFPGHYGLVKQVPACCTAHTVYVHAFAWSPTYSACRHTHTYLHTQTHTHAHTHTHTRTRAHTHIQAYRHTQTHLLQARAHTRTRTIRIRARANELPRAGLHVPT